MCDDLLMLFYTVCPRTQAHRFLLQNYQHNLFCIRFEFLRIDRKFFFFTQNHFLILRSSVYYPMIVFILFSIFCWNDRFRKPCIFIFQDQPYICTCYLRASNEEHNSKIILSRTISMNQSFQYQRQYNFSKRTIDFDETANTREKVSLV